MVLIDDIIGSLLNILRIKVSSLVSQVSERSSDVAPSELAVLSEVVTLLVPSGLAAFLGSSLAELVEDFAQVLDVDLVPDVIAFTDLEALLQLQNGLRELVDLEAAAVDGSAARAVDHGWGDNGSLAALGVLRAGFEHDDIDVAVEGVLGEGGDGVDVVPVVVLVLAAVVAE